MEGWRVDRWVEQSLAYPSDEFFPEMWTGVPWEQLEGCQKHSAASKGVCGSDILQLINQHAINLCELRDSDVCFRRNEIIQKGLEKGVIHQEGLWRMREKLTGSTSQFLL